MISYNVWFEVLFSWGALAGEEPGPVWAGTPCPAGLLPGSSSSAPGSTSPVLPHPTREGVSEGLQGLNHNTLLKFMPQANGKVLSSLPDQVLQKLTMSINALSLIFRGCVLFRSNYKFVHGCNS